MRRIALISCSKSKQNYPCPARELYAQKTGRSKNVKNLILTYADAEACFELFKQFADVWSKNCLTNC